MWQVGLFVATLALGGVSFSHQALWLIGTLTLAIAFASASQDIVIDAYAVEVLEPHEQGIAVGARTAVYRAAMFISGGLAITLAGWWTWSVVFMALAALYLPMMVVAWRAPRPAAERELAPASLREAVWEPFVNFLARRRAVELILFVLLYKLADNLAGALVRPFLVQVGFNDFDVGVATATIGLAATLLGTFLGGLLTTAMGLGHALWIFGLLQIVSNYGYVLIADAGPNRWLMYGAMGFESLTSGMGTGAFGVLLLRMTHVRFSTTQYALFTSIFALPRILAGPATGVMVDAVGWHDFFLFTLGVGIPWSAAAAPLRAARRARTRDPRTRAGAATTHSPRRVARAGDDWRARRPADRRRDRGPAGGGEADACRPDRGFRSAGRARLAAAAGNGGRLGHAGRGGGVRPACRLGCGRDRRRPPWPRLTIRFPSLPVL